MSDPLPKQSRTQSLAGLMKLTGEDSAGWSNEELGAILRHQLAAPLEYDLRTLAPGGERSIAEMTISVKSGAPPRSFGDLITHPDPPLELLTLMKDFARAGRDNGSLPPEVGTILYYAAIVLAQLRHKARITSLQDSALQKGVEWSLAQPWIEPRLRVLFDESVRANG